MNLFRVNFQEMYQRHLRRHSQFGINVLHLIAVAGIYLALYGIAFAFDFGAWIVGGVLAVYFVVLAANIPLRLLLVNGLMIAGLFGLFLLLPDLPIWAHLLLIVAWHRFQIWNHSIYHHQQDMSDFKETYKKGPALFFLLAVYELPILLNYLVFDRPERAT